MSTEDADAEESTDCPTCDASFPSTKSMKIHHTLVHGESIAGELVECNWCGESKRIEPGKAESRECHFCDHDCRAKWMSENRSGENHPRWLEGAATTCGHCGGTFRRPESQRHGKMCFCSNECRNEYWLENLGTWVSCDECGTEFKRNPSKIADSGATYCTYRCANNAHTGSGHPQYNGGWSAKVYGPGWNDRKRAAVRERDGHHCVDCGMEQSEHLERHGEKLHVHHILPALQVDDPERRNAMENLITLCRGCHLGKWEGIPLRPQIVN